MFDSAATRDALKQVYADGFEAYLNNEPIDNLDYWPDHRMTSRLYDEWIKGWRDARMQDLAPFRRLTPKHG